MLLFWEPPRHVVTNVDKNRWRCGDDSNFDVVGCQQVKGSRKSGGLDVGHRQGTFVSVG